MVTVTQYDNAGNIIDINDKGSHTAYTYDSMGNMTRSVHYQKNDRDNLTYTVSYTYDVLGNKLSESYTGCNETGDKDVSGGMSFT